MDGEVIEITLGGTPLITQIEWTPFAGTVKRWGWAMASGTKVNERHFDLAGRAIRYPLGEALRDVRYDEASRLVSFTHLSADGTAQPALDQVFGYDENSRLTGITTNAASWAIHYDANGNRTGLSLNGSPSAYSVEPTSNRTTSITNPARSLVFDNAGNTLSDSAADGSGYTATYNLRGQLATITKAGVTTRYTYNAAGQRVRKVSSTGPQSTVVFVYDQAGHLLGEYDQNGAALREYVWLRDTPMAMFTPDPANPSGEPLVYFIHSDHLNTPRVVVDRQNRVRWRWLAEPFGTSAPETNPSGLGVFTQNLRFPGQYADQESGLFYNYRRYYNSAGGQYTQSDPIGLTGGSVSTYGYVRGKPLQWVDPNGLSALGDAGALLGGWGRRVGGAAVGEAIFPLGGGVPGTIIGGQLGAWGGRAAGEWLNNLIYATSISNPFRGKPGSEVTCPNKNGERGQTRLYGPDGYPETDTDWDHSHDGLGKPHVHDWGRPEGGGPPRNENRGAGRLPEEGDPGNPLGGS